MSCSRGKVAEVRPRFFNRRLGDERDIYIAELVFTGGKVGRWLGP